MRRAFDAVCALILAIALAITLPLASSASPSALPSGKHRCKHKVKKHKQKATQRHKKRCRKKASETPTGSAPGKTDKPAKPGEPSGPPGRLLATEIEISSTQLRLQLSRATVGAGDTIVEQYNSGEDPHNLIFERAGSVAFSYPTLDPGATQRQTLNLGKGTWTLYCSLLDHRSLGMQATLTVN